MASLISLPLELFIQILTPENIDIEDVVNLSLTCKRLYTAINSNCIWRRKLFQRWPSLREVREDRLNNIENIKEMIREGIGYEKELLCCLAFLPYLYDENADYNNTYIQNIERLSFLFNTAEDTYSLRYHYFHDKLMKLINADPLDKRTNLTNVYCAKKFIVHMTQTDTTYKWKKLRELSDELQITEKVATLVAHWCQPCKLLFHSDVAASLDIIVQQILKVLKDVHPTHSTFTTSAEQFSLWKNRNIDDNYWHAQESRQIMNIIGRVIFREMNFQICDNLPRCDINQKIFFIDQVLESKNSSSILLQIIIQSVARRLGIRCDLLCSTDGLLLCWKAYYNPSRREINLIDMRPESYYSIDLFSDGCLLNEDRCIPSYEIGTSHMKLITPVELVLRLILHLSKFSPFTDNGITHSCWVSELTYMIKQSCQLVVACTSYHHSPTIGSELNWLPHGFNEDSENEWSTLFHLDAIEKDLRFGDLMAISGDQHKLRTIKSDFTDYIFSILSRYPMGKIQSRLGRKHLKYTVGMLVEVESACFKGAAVIIGWTSQYCNCNHCSPWSGIDRISKPIMYTTSYRILVNCDDVLYNILFNKKLNISQEFLKPLKMQKWINNSEIGQYFSHFEGTHYVPNQLLRWLYPMDAHILERKYSNS